MTPDGRSVVAGGADGSGTMAGEGTIAVLVPPAAAMPAARRSDASPFPEGYGAAHGGSRRRGAHDRMQAALRVLTVVPTRRRPPRLRRPVWSREKHRGLPVPVDLRVGPSTGRDLVDLQLRAFATAAKSVGAHLHV